MKHEKKIQPDTEIEKIKSIIIECNSICNKKNIKVNVSLNGNKSILSLLKYQFRLFDYIDTNSEVYKGILCVTRKALQEIKEERFDYYFHYVIEYFLTAPLEKIIGKKSQKIELFSGKKEVIEKEELVIPKNTKKENHIASEIRGKDLVKIKDEIEEVDEWELEEDDDLLNEEEQDIDEMDDNF